jgi:hypothetical protein
MLQPNINAKQIKELSYDSNLQPSATSINFTVENCHVNAYIEQIVLNFASADSTASSISCTLLDRGNGYTSAINGYLPITFAVIGLTTSPVINQNVITNSANTQTVIYVNESVQDSEGIGNIYVKLSKSSGTFNTSFTMTVIYRPESTYNNRLNTLDQLDNRKPQRVLSQVGVGTYGAPTSIMTDQTNAVAHRTNPRNNIDTVSYGFTVFSTSPIFYFGTPAQTKRWFIGFNKDNTANVGIVTFSYFNGSSFVGLATTQVASGALGPGTYQFANDGVVIFTPPTNWSALQMSNDPLTQYNTTINNLQFNGSYGGVSQVITTNNTVFNPNMFWIQCQVGFATTSSINISTVVPLISPDHPVTVRRRLLG